MDPLRGWATLHIYQRASVQKGAVQHMQPALKIHYGRTALALVGILALLVAVGFCVPALLGFVSGAIPLVSLLIAVVTVTGLRTLALRDRRNRVNAAFRDAMYAPPEPRETVNKPELPAKLTRLFDAEAGGSAAEPRPLSAVELRQAALAVAASVGDADVEDAVSVRRESTWEPVAVPIPVYVQAPKAERVAPEPLQLPAEPKPEGKPNLKQAAAEHRAGENGTDGSAESGQQLDDPRMNLDDVLQRRRA